MDHVYSSTVYAFSKPNGLDNAFTKVILSSDQGTLSPFEDERMCDKYDGCINPFYECVFSAMGLRLPLHYF